MAVVLASSKTPVGRITVGEGTVLSNCTIENAEIVIPSGLNNIILKGNLIILNENKRVMNAFDYCYWRAEEAKLK